MTDSKIDYLRASPGYLPGKVFSPWIGCDKHDEHGNLREGCRHCWAWAWARRRKRFAGHWGKDAPRYFPGEAYWKQPLRWQKQCERTSKRMRVLAAAMGDVFEALPAGHYQARRIVEERARLWWLIGQTPLLDWLVLTKRPENLRTMLPTGKHAGWKREAGRLAPTMISWPPPNLHLGVSCWDQASADRNVPMLLEAPAAMRWISYEPALGPVDLSRWLNSASAYIGGYRDGCTPRLGCQKLSWLVIGCESRGPRPGRPCDREWAHSVVQQCRQAGVPCYVKQLPDALTSKRLLKSEQLDAEGWPVELPDTRLLAPQRDQDKTSRG